MGRWGRAPPHGERRAAAPTGQPQWRRGGEEEEEEDENQEEEEEDERLPAGTRRLRAAVSASTPARGVLRSAGSGWGGQQRRGVGDRVRADPAAACPKSQP